MDAESDDAIFMGYALNSKAYRIFNKTSLIIEKSIHIVFDETNTTSRKGVVDDDVDFEDQIVEEPRRKINEIARKIHPLRNCKERKINMKIFLRLGSS